MAAIKRTAHAVWQGSGLEGTGHLSTPMSKFMQDQPYSFKARFQNEDGTLGTNPEELIVAAHAACYAMKLSFVLVGMGFTADTLDVKGSLQFEDGTIKSIHLNVVGTVPNISPAQFQEAAEDAKANCPISKALNADITMEAKLT